MAKAMKNFFKPSKPQKYTQGNNNAGGITDDYTTRKATANIINESENFCIRLTAGENVSKGHVLMASRTENFTVIKAGITDGAAGRNMPVGVALHAAADGASVLVVIAGVAEIISDGNVTTGDFISTSDTNAGQIIAASEPAVPSTANHWREIAHAIESRIGSGLFKAIIHFN